ncbi:helicase-exonuclease AddAB subunit AddA [Paenibacillus campi]|uniref:helicase-exonuclease AddAB subunit AddA n=1 Tax=Paenibacillus campi TaxID=3106031 RepID=UPI002AFEB042|nr:helicase-exonuclease AddAB subunit AddA [Paenibacillus sp. SGZ-1009]
MSDNERAQQLGQGGQNDHPVPAVSGKQETVSDEREVHTSHRERAYALQQLNVPRPEASTWTEDQWKAVSLRGNNLLVAAAAGSGKTAVLVERIIQQVTDPNHPLDVERMLVATFTKAAATEMRQRIRAALDREVLNRPTDERLRRQLALLGQASITTLHSFCMEVIQRYYAMIPLDPGFRIASEHECAMLREELLEELFEDKYTEEEERDNKQFHRLINWFGGERSDDAALQLVERLYHFARSHPWPEHWLRETARAFNVQDVQQLEQSVWVEQIMSDLGMALAGLEALLRQAIETALQPGGPAAYAETLHADLQLVHHLQDAVMSKPWSELYPVFEQITFGKLKSMRKSDELDVQLQETVKQLRETVKKSLGELGSLFFGRTAAEFAQELRESAPLMEELSELVIRFSERYQQEKQRHGWVDFSDLEHYALQVLRDPASTPEEIVPSAAALEYRARFDEVMLDEYQDTNSVQEQLVQLISRELPGNRFMVGDVKQSIYRFRLAEPGLFLQKYHDYRDDWSGAGRRIDLSRNFRSRVQVVDAVNMLFRQLMNEKVAEIVYDQRAELVAGANYPDGHEADYEPEFWLLERGGADTSERGDDEASDSDTSVGADHAELEAARLEAQAIIVRVKEMTTPGGKPLMIYDKSLDGLRAVEYRDMVILLRSTAVWAPLMLDELKLAGVPAYSDVEQGYFEAVEVDVMLSLLDIIDNPQQDIPFASVLRSPLVGLNEDELVQVRLARKQVTFYEAMTALLEASDTQRTANDPIVHPSANIGEGALERSQATDEWHDNAKLTAKLHRFHEQLQSWRAEAREGELGSLIWRIYRETGYIDWLGGLPGGVQRQHNLRMLYERALQFERASSAQGLFRFLRFIRRLKDTGGDLGSAAGGSEENAIRIMTIHKSKGLEFPVVFLAGMAKMFNMQDLNAPFLMHKELGFGPKFVDEDTRVSYPTLPNLAIRRRALKELLAEELRVLYVALTRPRDKLIMLATVKDLDKRIAAWSQVQSHPALELPDYVLSRARSYLDWLGPAFMRHRAARVFRERSEAATAPYAAILTDDPAAWQVHIVDSRGLLAAADAGEQVTIEPREHDPKWQALQQQQAPQWLDIVAAAWEQEQGGIHSDTVTERAEADGMTRNDGMANAIGTTDGQQYTDRADHADGADTPAEQAAAHDASLAYGEVNGEVNDIQEVNNMKNEAPTKQLPMNETDRLRLEQQQRQWAATIDARLDWTYPYEQAAHIAAKTTVSELKLQLVSDEVPDADLWEGIWDLNPQLKAYIERQKQSLARKQQPVATQDGQNDDPAVQLPLSASTDEHVSLSNLPDTGLDSSIPSSISGLTNHHAKRQPQDSAVEGNVPSATFAHAATSDMSANSLSTSADHPHYSLKLERPSFMEKKGMSGAERGTAYHTVMQRVPLHNGEVTIQLVEATKQRLVEQQILRQPEADSVEAAEVAAFFATTLGERMRNAAWLRRELAFSHALPVNEHGDLMLTQGIIDCLFREGERTILVDYKTDRVLAHEGGIEMLKERYRVQLELYALAVQQSLGWNVDELWLYFFDGKHQVRLDG